MRFIETLVIAFTISEMPAQIDDHLHDEIKLGSTFLLLNINNYGKLGQNSQLFTFNSFIPHTIIN